MLEEKASNLIKTIQPSKQTNGAPISPATSPPFIRPTFHLGKKPKTTPPRSLSVPSSALATNLSRSLDVNQKKRQDHLSNSLYQQEEIITELASSSPQPLSTSLSTTPPLPNSG